MPKIAVNEYRHARAWEDDVGFASKAGNESLVEAVAEAAANVTQLTRPCSSMLDQEFTAAIARLDESARQYITGYVQALLDQRGKQ